MLFICYPNCSTCKKAKAWLDASGISYTFRDIKQQNPTAEELRSWLLKSGLPSKRFFNTSGLPYRTLGLKDKLAEMDDAARIALLSTDGMLVKRPILIGDDFVLVGFKESEWAEHLSN